MSVIHALSPTRWYSEVYLYKISEPWSDHHFRYPIECVDGSQNTVLHFRFAFRPESRYVSVAYWLPVELQFYENCFSSMCSYVEIRALIIKLECNGFTHCLKPFQIRTRVFLVGKWLITIYHLSIPISRLLAIQDVPEVSAKTVGMG